VPRLSMPSRVRGRHDLVPASRSETVIRGVVVSLLSRFSCAWSCSIWL